jgi:hypothetical protein
LPLPVYQPQAVRIRSTRDPVSSPDPAGVVRVERKIPARTYWASLAAMVVSA